MVLINPPVHFVGRERECALLQRHLDAACEGHGRVVLVRGEAGIGKTALFARFAHEVEERPLLILAGAAYELPASPPYGPWLQVFETYSSTGDLPAVPAWLRPGGADAGSDSQGAMFREASRFLFEAAARVPLLILLEDLQWADTASLELLRYVAQRISGAPILIVAPYREDELTHDMPLYQALPQLIRESNADRIRLERFGHGEIRDLIGRHYCFDADDESRLVDYLQSHAEGIPLFIIELLRELTDAGAITRDGETWKINALESVPVPPLVRQMIETRLRRLDENVRSLLTVAAMISFDVQYDLWRDVSGEDEHEIERATESGLAAGLLVQTSDGSMAFSHALVREALRVRIIPPRRRHLHQRIAEAIIARSEHEPDPTSVAYHLHQARDPRAPHWLIRAGEHACSVYAYENAIELLSAALEQSDLSLGDLKIQALRLRGLAYEILGNFDLSLEDRQSALRIASEHGTTDQTWLALVELGSLWSAQDYREAGEYIHRALNLAHETGDAGMIAHSLNRIGNWHTNAGQSDDALRCHNEALQIFQTADDMLGVATTLDLLGMAAYMHGDMTASDDYLRRAVRLFREQDDRRSMASVLPTLMVTRGGYDSDTVRVAEGSADEALAYGNEGLSIARDIGWLAGESFALIHIGLFLGLQGAYGEALNRIKQGLQLATDITHRQWITAGHFSMGIVLADILATGPAKEHLEHALASAQAVHSQFWLQTSTAALARVYLLEENLWQAGDLLDQVIDPDSGTGSIGLRQCWFQYAELELARGRPDAALTIVERLIRDVPGEDAEIPVPHLEWLRGKVLARLQRHDIAAHALHRARHRALQVGYRSLLWQIDLEMGHLFSASGQTHEAAEAYRRSRRQIRDNGETIDDMALRAGYRNAALACLSGGSPRSDGQEHGLHLTPRETDVLRLVARGLTDAEVGSQLHISPRTVGRHLQSIYNKLGVSSRTAATSLALERQML